MNALVRCTARAAVLSLLATGGIGAAGPTATPTVEALVQRVADSWDPLSVELLARMTTVRPERPDTEIEIRIRRGLLHWC